MFSIFHSSHKEVSHFRVISCFSPAQFTADHEMTGRGNKGSPRRRSERVKEKWKKSLKLAERKTIKAERAVDRPRRYYQCLGYAKLSSFEDHGLSNVLEKAGLKDFYSCLDWECPSHSVPHFLVTSKVVHEEILYIPPRSQTPLVITVEDLAEALHLSLEGISETSDRVVAMNAEFQAEEIPFTLGSNYKYFALATARNKNLYIAGIFANQALFLMRNRSSMSTTHMGILRVALSGKPVAWAKVLWNKLVKRITSFGRKDLSKNPSNILFAPVVVALLSRMKHRSEHRVRFPTLCSSQPEESELDSDDRLLVDILAKNSRKRARLINEEIRTDCEEYSSRFAICGVAENGRQLMKAETEYRLHEDSKEVPLGESGAVDAVDMNRGSRRDANDQTNEASSTTIFMNRGNSSGCCQNLAHDCRQRMKLKQPVNNEVHSDPPNGPQLVDRSHIQREGLEGDVGQGSFATDLMDCVLKATPEVDHGHNLHGVMEMENDAIDQIPKNVPMKFRRTSAEILGELNDLQSNSRMPESVKRSCGEGQTSEQEPEGELIKRSCPRSSRAIMEETLPMLMTEIADVPASSLVKMVCSVRHFLHGLDEVGVPSNVDVKLKAGELMDALKAELEIRDLKEFCEENDLFGMNWSMDKLFDAQWTIHDILRKSQKESVNLTKELDKILTRFSLDKNFVLPRGMNLTRRKLVISDRDAQDEGKMPLFERLKVLKDKMNEVNERVIIMEVVQRRHRHDWLKQRNVLVQRWSDVKFEYSTLLDQIEKLQEEVEKREDALKGCADELYRESVRRRCSEANTASLRDEMQHVKGALVERSDEIQQTLKERDEGLKAAKHLTEKLEKATEEMQRKDLDLIKATSQIDLLTQTAKTISDRMDVQNGILKDKDEEIRSLKEEIAKWMEGSSAWKLERDILCKEKQRIEMERLDQIQLKEKMKESVEELKCKLTIGKERITKSEKLLELKEQEINLLKARADATEKKLQECKKTRDMAIQMVQKQKVLQDTHKKQAARLKEDCEKLEFHLDKVLKRESKLLTQVEEERERMEEGLLDQEQQDICSMDIDDFTENQTASYMRDQHEKLRVEKKEILASSSQRLGNIVDSHKLLIKLCDETSSASAPA